MSDPDPTQQMKALEAKIAAVKAAREQTTAHQEEHYSQANLAWRMVTEMVAGLGIGFGIGYGLDALFGTLPWMMVLFTVLGLVAGVRVMIRSAAEIQEKQLALQAGGQVADQGTEIEKRDRDGD
ncbi:ATP synthase F0 subunit I [Salipiger aestuarii]|uniref:ATP synthase protein I n=1 Tax=Salipiger aestuarii TaxID=568098 RepID=A0A327YU52_9RHOB|nr:AtpZ/AtpI family protein [Salipiger aestuarii]EIE50184.1 ATP synthase F0, subunit I [Citreicella sp. 357]KAA8609963.1 ATP synthase F0 subunit I [Salipiger aestuarii]KAA8616287.1 ATP synthase F0 subunit I [Salipiger aestuarii]KAB2543223.1 ATP synthase F0 subunit I [Salipiger aestuarii]RAK21549.1 ATP synthase protein I [Salipiger aestuarii]